MDDKLTASDPAARLDQAAACREGGTGDGYEPPKIESVLTPQGLQREILYAGVESPVESFLFNSDASHA